MNQNYIYTTGYEGEKLDKFIQKLLKQGIDIVVDIRQTPYSRKPGFSKTSLANELQKYDLKYLHVQELGTPKPLRQYLSETGDYEGFFKMYKNFVLAYKESLFDLVELSKKFKLCLLCFEKDQHFCHRLVVADLIAEFSNNTTLVEHI